jgi:hypothetical protein
MSTIGQNASECREMDLDATKSGERTREDYSHFGGDNLVRALMILA